MDGIFIVGIVFYTIYKIIELAMLQKERKLMISKLNEISPEMMQTNLSSLQSAQNAKFQNNPFFMLRLGVLSLGVGIGWILGWVFYIWMKSCESTAEHLHDLDSVFIASVALCAGIALVVVYLIEQKAIKEAKKGK